jgi:uncharacterized RDD family membrane protein YckC
MHLLNRTTLRTPESVELEFVLAGIGNRSLALGIDYTILSLVLALYTYFLAVVIGGLIELLEYYISDFNDLGLWVAAIAFFIFFAIYVGYFVFFEVFWQGQTPGKRLARIRVVRDDGRPVRLPQATLRALLRPADDILFLGVLLIVLNPREKRAGDWMAGTIVVQEERAASAKNLQLSPQAQELAEKLTAALDFSKLTPGDFAILRNYLYRRSEFTAKAQTNLSRKLAEQLKNLLGLEAIPPDTKPQIFLEAIYLGYQQQSASDPDAELI